MNKSTKFCKLHPLQEPDKTNIYRENSNLDFVFRNALKLATILGSELGSIPNMCLIKREISSQRRDHTAGWATIVNHTNVELSGHYHISVHLTAPLTL